MRALGVCTRLFGGRSRSALFSMIFAAVWAAPAFAQVNGAIFTTDVDCDGTNVNIFTDRKDVYLDGGPRHPGAAGLPDGFYYVQVTEPNGTLLGSSLFCADQTPVEVVGGVFVTCYKLWDILGKASHHSQRGYDATSNNGGEYKVWVSKNSAFPNSESKTDNFKVQVMHGPHEPPAQTEFRAIKFYDLDQNGVQGDPATEPPIANWHIELRRASDNALIACALTDGGGEVQFLVDQNGTQYVVVEIMVDPYINTTPTSVQVTANQDVVVVAFGNVALERRSGLGRTKGFWHNENGAAVLAGCDPAWRNLLNDFCLVWPDGTEFTVPGGSFSDAFAAFSNWIVGTGAEGNMAYILSTQLAATALNVECGFMSDFAGVFVEWNGSKIDIHDLFDQASDLICDFPLTLGSDAGVAAARASQELLKSFFDGINNNIIDVWVVLPAPVPFTPVPCP